MFAVAMMLVTPSTISAQELGWVSGIGEMPCSEMDSVGDAELIPWVQGYWTGANLYLGGTDTCQERRAVSGLTDEALREQLDQQCVAGASIMVAAYNALKSIPNIPGTSAAECGEMSK